MKFRRILVSNYGHKLLCHRNSNQTIIISSAPDFSFEDEAAAAERHSNQRYSRKFHREKWIEFDCAKNLLKNLLRLFWAAFIENWVNYELSWQKFLCRGFSFGCLHLSNNKHLVSNRNFDCWRPQKDRTWPARERNERRNEVILAVHFITSPRRRWDIKSIANWI